jgi:hypothetical protein
MTGHRMGAFMAAMAAALVMTLATGIAASRSRIELTPTGAIRAPAVRVTLEGGVVQIVCEATLGGAVERLIAKIRGSQIGTIESDTVANCSNSLGGTTTLDYLTRREEGGPGRIDYNSITGALPSITGALFLFTFGFLIGIRSAVSEARCLYSVTLGVSTSTNPVRSLRILTNAAVLVRQLAGNILCPEGVQHVGTMSLTPELRVGLLER